MRVRPQLDTEQRQRLARVLTTAEAVAFRFGGGAEEIRRIADDLAVPGGHEAETSSAGLSCSDVALSALPAGDEQTERGAWYTPRDLAGFIAATAIGGSKGRTIDEMANLCLLDPTCGGGVVLLALADHLVGLGLDPRAAVNCLRGADIDPIALAAARCALGLWSVEQCGRWADLEVCELDVVHGDVPDTWLGRFDAVAGNPPFLSQLRTRSARSGAERDAVGPRGYADAAAVVLGRALRWVASGGTVALLQPRSIVGSRDGESTRHAVSTDHRLAQMWFDDRAMFAASVRVCLPVVVVGTTDEQQPTLVTQGLPVAAAGSVMGGSWSSLAARAAGVPSVSIGTDGAHLGQIADVRADFRQWFYDVAKVVYEAEPDQQRPSPEQLGVLTSGLIDPLCARWGAAKSSVAKRHYFRPVVDSAWLEGRGELWRGQPKVVVANQTKVIEAVADAEGLWVGLTPTLSVVPENPNDVWAIAVLLTSPVATAWAVERSSGSGLSVGAVRLTAELMRAVPLPQDQDKWHEAAAMAKAGRPATEVGRQMMSAFAVVDDDLYSWWATRLPKRTET